MIKALNAAMHPRKFIEFSMAAPIHMPLPSPTGPIMVNAPPPEKYAVHKLLMYGKRSVCECVTVLIYSPQIGCAAGLQLSPELGAVRAPVAARRPGRRIWNGMAKLGAAAT